MNSKKNAKEQLVIVITMLVALIIVCFVSLSSLGAGKNLNFASTALQNQKNYDIAISSNIEDITDTAEYSKNQLVVTENNIDANNKITTIQNIQNFLNFGATNFRSNITKQDQIVNALGLPEQAAENLSDSNMSDILSSEYIKVATSSIWGDNLVEESSVTTSDKYMELYNVLLRVPEKDHFDGNGVRQLGYKALFYATWLKMPLYRLTDCMAMSATNGAVWGNATTREANATFSYIKSGDYLTDEYSLSDDPSVLYEYSGYTYAISCDLPNSTGGRNYEYMLIMMSSELCCSTDFNMFFAYGHKNVSGEVSLDSNPGVAISFKDNVKTYQATMLSSY